MKRTLIAVALLAGTVACSGNKSQTESMNPLASVFWSAQEPGTWTADLSGTIAADLTQSTVDVSGSAQLDNSFASETMPVTFTATMDGVEVASMVIDYTDPFPQNYSLSVPDVFAECSVGDTCSKQIVYRVSAAEPGLVVDVYGNLTLAAEDVGVGDPLVDGLSATLSE